MSGSTLRMHVRIDPDFLLCLREIKFCKWLDNVFVATSVYSWFKSARNQYCATVSASYIYSALVKTNGRTNCVSTYVTNQQMHINKIYFISSYLQICFDRFCVIQECKEYYMYRVTIKEINTFSVLLKRNY
jgi:hypothetical protein